VHHAASSDRLSVAGDRSTLVARRRKTEEFDQKNELAFVAKTKPGTAVAERQSIDGGSGVERSARVAAGSADSVFQGLSWNSNPERPSLLSFVGGVTGVEFCGGSKRLALPQQMSLKEKELQWS
jgi:hypothetical protein